MRVATKPGLWQSEITALTVNEMTSLLLTQKLTCISKFSIILGFLYSQYYLFPFQMIKYRKTDFVLMLIRYNKSDTLS